MSSKIKYNAFFILGAVFIISIILIMLITNGKGTYSAAGDPAVTIECPERINANSQVTCTIGITIPSGNVVSVNANYNLQSGLTTGNITFNEDTTCTSGSCFKEFVSTQNGFAVVYENTTTGATSNKIIGTITFTANGTYGNNYTVGLNNIEICAKVSGEYQMLSGITTTASDNLRINNNVSTLSNITAPNTISSNFDSTNHKFTATVSTNVTSLTVTPTVTNGSGAIVTGTLTYSNLHYGTETYGNSITVTAEDGTETKYTVEITRQFEFADNAFNNSNYVYNASSNYLYIKNDIVNNVINNLPNLPNGSNLTYNISNNKLEILYNNNEMLKSINIINFTTDASVITIINDTIYISSAITLQQIKNKITSSNLSIDFYNGATKITNNSTNIVTGNTAKISHDNAVLETYNIVIEYLTFDNSLVKDDSNMVLKRVPLNQTYGELKNKINTSGTISLATTGATVNDSYKLRTGDVLTIVLNNDTTISYTLSVVGCLDDDVAPDLADVIVVYRAYRNRIELNTEQFAAADITGDGSLGLDDVIVLYRFYRGRINSLEVH